MSGGTLGGVGRFRSAFYEFVFKPSLMAGVVLVSPFVKKFFPIRQNATHEFRNFMLRMARKEWDGDPFQYTKISLLSSVLLGLLEADNAYLQYFFRCLREWGDEDE